MATKKSGKVVHIKGKAGKPKANDEQEPVTDFRRKALTLTDEESEEGGKGEQLELTGQETPKIANLESKFRLFVKHDDAQKHEKAQADDYAEQCLIIMNDTNITTYKRGNVYIHIKQGKLKLEGNID